MKLAPALIFLAATAANAQTLGDMSKPLPWRMRYAQSPGSAATWTGGEEAQMVALMGSLRRGFGALGGTEAFPEALLRARIQETLRDARQQGYSSAQAREMCAHGLWTWACGAWLDVSGRDGDHLDGEDLVAMAQTLGVPAAQAWARTKRDFRDAGLRIQGEP